MNNVGVIIRRLRQLSGMSVQQMSKKINRSKGWISEIENDSGRCKVTDEEFNKIVDLLGGQSHKAMFKTWAASVKNRDQDSKTLDGAVLKFIRTKKNISLENASKLTRLSKGYLSKIENGIKPVTLELRNQIMVSYGYSPSSFKNLSTDPLRSKVVPIQYKLKILTENMNSSQIEELFSYAQKLTNPINKQEIL